MKMVEIEDDDHQFFKLEAVKNSVNINVIISRARTTYEKRLTEKK